MPPRPFILSEANYQQLQENRPQLAILFWGASEAHGYHLPCGTDNYEAQHIAETAAEKAWAAGARVVVLGGIPFGNNEQQLDQVATISFQTTTARAILADIARSLKSQGMDRLIILNGHGGNEFKPLVRDIQSEFDMLIVVMDFYRLCPETMDEIFDNPGDHAGDLETSLMLHLCPDLVVMDQAGSGARVPFELDELRTPGVWTPRPWSRSHPDTGSGDPSQATAEKGARYFAAITDAASRVLVELAKAKKGQLPFV